MKPRKRTHLYRNGFGAAFLCATLVLIASSAFVVLAEQASQPAANLNQFVGTWSAVHAGTSYFVLDLHEENGTLAGGIRVCSFTMNREGEHADITITNKTLSVSLPVLNVVANGKSLSFDWKDPDGDENHLKFELIAGNSGRLNWHGLPAGAKMPSILLAKQTT